MGFRNPVTTGDPNAVDTRPDPLSPGVTVYQDESGVYPLGVVDFRDAYSDGPARLTLRPITRTLPDPFTGEPVTEAYENLFRLEGAPLDGTAAAALELRIEELAGGSKRSRATLYADVVDLPGYALPRLVSSRTEREALDEKYNGLTVIRTDRAGRVETYDAAAGLWRFRITGTAAGTTDAGGLYFWSHGAGEGRAPRAWGLTPRNQTTTALDNVFKPLAWFADTTNLQLKAIRTDTSALLTTNPVSVAWWAEW